MATLIALLVAAHAHRFDPAVLVLEETPAGWQTRWTAPPGDSRVPVLPCGPPVDCPLESVGVRGPGEAIIRVHWLDGTTATGIATETTPWTPERPPAPRSPWTPLAAIAVGWRAPHSLALFAVGLALGAAAPMQLLIPGWLALSVALAARESLRRSDAPGRLWPLGLGVIHGLAIGDLALPAAGLLAALLLHRLPGLPWVIGTVGVIGVLDALT